MTQFSWLGIFCFLKPIKIKNTVDLVLFCKCITPKSEATGIKIRLDALKSSADPHCSQNRLRDKELKTESVRMLSAKHPPMFQKVGKRGEAGGRITLMKYQYEGGVGIRAKGKACS